MVLPNGVVWQQHLLVLMVSAKLLADAEAAMQRHGDAAGSKQQRMGAGRHLVFGGGAGEAGKASFATVDHFETVA
jgi:hypothetical protein